MIFTSQRIPALYDLLLYEEPVTQAMAEAMAFRLLTAEGKVNGMTVEKIDYNGEIMDMQLSDGRWYTYAEIEELLND